MGSFNRQDNQVRLLIINNIIVSCWHSITFGWREISRAFEPAYILFTL